MQDLQKNASLQPILYNFTKQWGQHPDSQSARDRHDNDVLKFVWDIPVTATIVHVRQQLFLGWYQKGEVKAGDSYETLQMRSLVSTVERVKGVTFPPATQRRQPASPRTMIAGACLGTSTQDPRLQENSMPGQREDSSQARSLHWNAPQLLLIHATSSSPQTVTASEPKLKGADRAQNTGLYVSTMYDHEALTFGDKLIDAAAGRHEHSDSERTASSDSPHTIEICLGILIPRTNEPSKSIRIRLRAMDKKQQQLLLRVLESNRHSAKNESTTIPATSRLAEARLKQNTPKLPTRPSSGLRTVDVKCQPIKRSRFKLLCLRRWRRPKIRIYNRESTRCDSPRESIEFFVDGATTTGSGVSISNDGNATALPTSGENDEANHNRGPADAVMDGAATASDGITKVSELLNREVDKLQFTKWTMMPAVAHAIRKEHPLYQVISPSPELRAVQKLLIMFTATFTFLATVALLFDRKPLTYKSASLLCIRGKKWGHLFDTMPCDEKSVLHEVASSSTGMTGLATAYGSLSYDFTFRDLLTAICSYLFTVPITAILISLFTKHIPLPHDYVQLKNEKKPSLLKSCMRVCLKRKSKPMKSEKNEQPANTETPELVRKVRDETAAVVPQKTKDTSTSGTPKATAMNKIEVTPCKPWQDWYKQPPISEKEKCQILKSWRRKDFIGYIVASLAILLSLIYLFLFAVVYGVTDPMVLYKFVTVSGADIIQEQLVVPLLKAIFILVLIRLSLQTSLVDNILSAHPDLINFRSLGNQKAENLCTEVALESLPAQDMNLLDPKLRELNLETVAQQAGIRISADQS